MWVQVSGPSSVYVGQTINYELSFYNSGPDVATGVVITDTLPAGTSFVGYASDPCWTQSGSTLTCAIGNASVNAVGMIKLALNAPGTPGAVTNSARIVMDQHDPTPADNTSSVVTSVTVPTQADVAVSVGANPTSVHVGDLVTFSLGVVNNGPATATNVTVTDALPAGFVYQPGMSDGRCTASGQTVTCAVGSFGNWATDGWNIVAQATASGTFTDTATVSADQPDPNPSNNSASTTVRVIGPADMSVAISGPSSVDVRTVNQYTFSVTNGGPDSVGAVTLDVTLPAQMTNAGWSSPQGSCQGADVAPSPSTFHCDLGAMAAGTTVQVVLDTYAYQEGSGTLTASVASDHPDSNQSNNAAGLPTAVNPVTDLQAMGGAYVTPGKAGRATETFTITVYNGGPSTASAVRLSDSWSGTTKKLQLSSVSITQGSCVSGASSADCSIGALAPGATATLTITLASQGTGTVTVSSIVSGPEKDPDTSNNSATITATVS